MGNELVLVTGGSGFLGAHCIVRLLADGYRVRTTIRSLDRAEEVRALVRRGGGAPSANLSFVAAELTDDAGWPAAVDGVDYVLHTASPFPPTMPKDEDELIVPAREGTLRVLGAARAANVRRVVVTSSFAAIGYGGPDRDRPYTEEDWTNPDSPVSAYIKSKTLAERAAWDFMDDGDGSGSAMELAVVNPVGIFGPALGPRLSSSVQIVQRFMNGDVPGLPKVSSGIVDVRDVASLHVLAMVSTEAAGQRFLASAGDSMSMAEIARTLRDRLGTDAAKVPTRVLPDLLVRAVAIFNKSLAEEVVPRLGEVKHLSNEKARRVLGWAPLSNEDALVATAQSLLDLGLVGTGGTK
ncbi:epimerase [Arthrobacter sp. ERGS1:01]|uniref:SDR family oxidoreductase n=1 Tax=Arthrobacter sp. ERGS1:01 TaxID=1704044 RepID=UPI0006B6575D|nr:aldehyde reductase [Arthrobacter sp. ERGS1:01]ALE07844.1 epimerase [Arthrobacter sp. ERGS1:01]